MKTQIFNLKNGLTGGGSIAIFSGCLQSEKSLNLSIFFLLVIKLGLYFTLLLEFYGFNTGHKK